MPDWPLGVDQAGAILRRRWPEAAVTDVVVRTGGQLSAVYEVRCAGPPYEVIVKVYAERWRWKLAKEVHVYGMLGDHGVGPIPAILDAEESTGLIGSGFTVMTKLPGRPLSEVVAELDSDAVRTIYRHMGAALSAVHRIGQDSYGYLTTRVLDPEPDNAAYMTRQFAKKLREFMEYGGDPGLRDAVAAYVDEMAWLFARCEAPMLCHNDFHEGNVLVDRTVEGWAVTGFVDVENAIAADPLLDLAKTGYYSIRSDEAKLSGFLDGYGRPLPADWPERSRLYRLYHALELWDWFASIGNTAPLPGIAEDIRIQVA